MLMNTSSISVVSNSGDVVSLPLDPATHKEYKFAIRTNVISAQVDAIVPLYPRHSGDDVGLFILSKGIQLKI